MCPTGASPATHRRGTPGVGALIVLAVAVPGGLMTLAAFLRRDERHWPVLVILAVLAGIVVAVAVLGVDLGRGVRAGERTQVAVVGGVATTLVGCLYAALGWRLAQRPVLAFGIWLLTTPVIFVAVFGLGIAAAALGCDDGREGCPL